MKVSEIRWNPANCTAFGITLLCCAFPALFINTFYGYVPFISMASAWILSTGYVLLIRKKLYVEHSSKYVICRRGEKAAFSVTVGNRGRLPVPSATITFFRVDSYFANEEQEETRISLSAGEEKSFQFGILFNHIGIYKAGMKSIRISDFFGILYVEYSTDAVMDVCVSPCVRNIIALKDNPDAASESMKSTVVSLHESMDYSGVREYHFGDPIKSIHWKLSAHTREYVTKQHEAYTNPGTTVFADFIFREKDTERRVSRMDCIAEAAVSAAFDCFSRGLDYEIQYRGISGIYQKYIPENFVNFSQWVSDIPFQEQVVDVNEMQMHFNAMKSAYSYSNIVYCTTEAGMELIDALAGLQQSGKQITVILIVPDDSYDEEYETMTASLKKLDAVRAEYHIVRSGKFAMETEMAE